GLHREDLAERRHDVVHVELAELGPVGSCVDALQPVRCPVPHLDVRHRWATPCALLDDVHDDAEHDQDDEGRQDDEDADQFGHCELTLYHQEWSLSAAFTTLSTMRSPMSTRMSWQGRMRGLLLPPI